MKAVRDRVLSCPKNREVDLNIVDEHRRIMDKWIWNVNYAQIGLYRVTTSLHIDSSKVELLTERYFNSCIDKWWYTVNQ